jgi:GNAT superfamily N-acetyltransferase
MIVVRAYSCDDLEAVAELMGELGYPASSTQMQKRMEAISSHPDYATLVAECEGEVVGMIGLRLTFGYEHDGHVVQITVLVVKAAFRGRGVGKELIRHAEKWAREKGAAAIVLTSGKRPEREAAHRFYRHMGFSVTGLRFSKKL